jgi:hypothetical protein
MTATVQAAILALPETAWVEAVDADGSLRDGADVAELTGMLGDLTGAVWPAGMRVIVRRERPHPGAQLTFTDHDGWRHQSQTIHSRQTRRLRPPRRPVPHVPTRRTSPPTEQDRPSRDLRIT